MTRWLQRIKGSHLEERLSTKLPKLKVMIIFLDAMQLNSHDLDI